MKSFKSTDLLLSAGILAGLLAVFVLAGQLETRTAAFEDVLDEDELSLQGERLKGYALGFEGLLADWYWMRSLQYIGDKLYKAKDQQIDLDNLKPLDPKLLYPLLDNATTLDPEFLAVYSYGANVLPAIDQKQAIAIAQKGIRNNPDEWTLYHQLGFIYWKLKDYENASKTYANGAKLKAAPEWMTVMSARMNSEGGSRETAREIYTQLYKSAVDSKTRLTAELRLAELDSLDEREVLDEVLSEFKRRNGKCPSRWIDVFEDLKTKKLKNDRELRQNADNEIVDPTDAPYLIDKTTCSAKLDLSKTGLPRS